MTERRDAVVIGGGHNGLVAAAYLAKGGLKPLLLERKGIVGGAVVTEDLAPGFKAPTVAHTVGPLRASICRDLGLALETLSPEPRVLALSPEGRALRLYSDPARTTSEMSAFSQKDAKRWADFDRALSRASSALARLIDMTPPDTVTPRMGDALPLMRAALSVRGLGREGAQDLLRWGPMAVADFASEWFETDLLRAVVAARGTTGAFAGPRSAGTTANLLLQAAVSSGGGAGSTVLVKGGPGALSGALSRIAQGLGAEIRLGAEVEAITVADGRATGVRLRGGEEIPARVVLSGADPKTTVLSLLDPALLDPDDVLAFRRIRSRGTIAKVNLALATLPRFAALGTADAGEDLKGRIHISPSIDALERAWDDAKYGRVSKEPYLEATIPTLSDPSLAPKGAHVMSVCVQYVPYAPDSGGREGRRNEVLEVALRTLEAYAPGIRGDIVTAKVLTPADLEAEYGMVGGHPYHGEHALDQLFVGRPVLGFSRYRGPVEGLYLCSAGTHPGGGVTGAPGANAAREVLRDLR